MIFILLILFCRSFSLFPLFLSLLGSIRFCLFFCLFCFINLLYLLTSHLELVRRRSHKRGRFRCFLFFSSSFVLCLTVSLGDLALDSVYSDAFAVLCTDLMPAIQYHFDCPMAVVARNEMRCFLWVAHQQCTIALWFASFKIFLVVNCWRNL